MIQEITKVQRSIADKFDFSILIPTWNNLEILQHCLSGLRKNSSTLIQVIIIINEGKDNTLEWVESLANVDYIYSPKNIGICYGLNAARSLVKSDYLIYMNDDMYPLPEWDIVLKNEIQLVGHDRFMLSATMIEPTETGNPCVVVRDFGRNPATFQEELILKEWKLLRRRDWLGASWPPNVVSTTMWDLVGGMSVEYSPGMYSDPDLSRKLYDVGVRHFKGLGNSLVYHFGSKSTGKVRKNNGRKTFIRKWGISANDFYKYYIKMGETTDQVIQDHPFGIFEKFLQKMKRIMNSW